MENISKRLSSEDTGASMYLSFDAESTMSTACYKTLETMTDISASSIDMNESTNDHRTYDKHVNSTLEADNNSQIKSPLKTVKKVEMPLEMKIQTPLKALPKNIMKEYKALCSTPSKEQLLRTVDVTRGSDATRCIDLGLAFLGVEDEKPAFFPPPTSPTAQNEESRVNLLSECEDVSTSTCSSVEITTSHHTSVIERKLGYISTAGSTIEKESVKETKTASCIKDILVSDVKAEKTIKATNPIKNDMVQSTQYLQNEFVDENIDSNNRSIEIAPKPKLENMKYMETIKECLEKPNEKTPITELEVTGKNRKVKSTGKPKIAILSQNLRRSIREPGLQISKKPMLNSGNIRRSLLPTVRKPNLLMDAEIEIPLLMSKMLKITGTPMETRGSDKKSDEPIANIEKKPMAAENRRSLMDSTKTRTSLIPSVVGDKRSFNFAHRMSVVVKTTLNSPARKIARKNSMNGVMTTLQRGSAIPQKTLTTEASKNKKSEALIRKSILPTISDDSSAKAMQQESVVKVTTTKRTSLLPSTKRDIVYTCSYCKEKFRIKSLLDAHKRSHESDIIIPAFIKKPTALPQSSNGFMHGKTNQCKYCDKKFALTKALHIHLLQNCSKIPPSDKRKLEYTDLNHVEKAQLPNIFPRHNHQSNASSAASSINATPRNTLKHSNMSFPKNTTESVNENKDVNKNALYVATTIDGNNLTLPYGSVQKSKKITAHAGVYRTPSKSVPCHLCKSTFKSILDYTNHNLTKHNSNKTNNTHDNDDKISVGKTANDVQIS